MASLMCYMRLIRAYSVYAAIKYASEAMEKTSAEKPTSSGSIIATASGTLCLPKIIA